MSKDHLYFKLYASCIPVKGYHTSFIYDVQRGQTQEIPNLLFDVFKENENKTVGELKAHFNHEMNEGVDSFFNLFKENEIGFYTSEPESFPAIDLTWYSPHKILTAVLEMDESKRYDLLNVLQQLDKLGCASVQIRFFYSPDFDELKSILAPLKRSRIRIIDLFMKEDTIYTQEALTEKVFMMNARVLRVALYGSDRNKVMEPSEQLKDKRVIYTKQIINHTTKEHLYPEHFTTNIESFTEAQKHNLGLNRKVSVDYLGNIKNYPAHKTIYGNATIDRIEDVIKKNDFTAKWYIANDQIEKCKDCQYRYMCVFNSDLEQKENKWYKTEDCGFDPYNEKVSEENILENKTSIKSS